MLDGLNTRRLIRLDESPVSKHKNGHSNSLQFAPMLNTASYKLKIVLHDSVKDISKKRDINVLIIYFIKNDKGFVKNTLINILICGVASLTILSRRTNFKVLSLFIFLEIDCFHS